MNFGAQPAAIMMQLQKFGIAAQAFPALARPSCLQ
jgi:hypothetical protein